MQSTVLELVQEILSEMGGDEINSISDTIEATDVATIMRRVYMEMVDEYSLPTISSGSSTTTDSKPMETRSTVRFSISIQRLSSVW
jgi:hypothetical protein